MRCADVLHCTAINLERSASSAWKLSRNLPASTIRPTHWTQKSNYIGLQYVHMAARDSLKEVDTSAGRYLLYVSYACPWASRCLAVLALKGLEDVIDVAVVAPIWDYTKPGVDEHRGWVFDASVTGATTDPLFGAKTLREVYERCAGAEAVKFTVPLLVDKDAKTIVNNESADIVRMFDAEFNAFARRPEVDLYPIVLRDQIDKLNAHIYDAINNGVYKCGFATKQAPYEDSFNALFDALEHYDNVLEKSRYLCGKTLTESDLRLVMTLVRFDEVYVVHFKCNKRPIRYFRNLFRYTCDVYQAGIAHTVNISHIKQHYYGSHKTLNPFGIIPLGSPDYSDFSVPHGRETL